MSPIVNPDLNESLIEFLKKWPGLPIGTVLRVEAGAFEFRLVLQSRAPLNQPEPPKFTR